MASETPCFERIALMSVTMAFRVMICIAANQRTGIWPFETN
jgi:hypothetical protein